MPRPQPAVSFKVKFEHHKSNKEANESYRDALSSSSGDWIDDNTDNGSNDSSRSSRDHRKKKEKKKKHHKKKHRDKHKHGDKKHRKEKRRRESSDDYDEEDEASDRELIADAEPDSGESTIDIDLNQRNTRLTIWSIAYFIFSIADFAKDINGANEAIESKLKTGYQVWAASAFFLLIASSLMFISCNPKYNPLTKSRTRGRRDPAAILKKVCCGMLIFVALLRMIGLGMHNQIQCDDSWCGSFYFSQDLLVAGFGAVIGMDLVNVCKCVKTKLRASRIMIYSAIMVLCGILEFVYYAHASPPTPIEPPPAPAPAPRPIDDYDDYDVRRLAVGQFYESGSSMLKSSATGWFFIWIIMMMVWIISASIYAGNYTCRCVRKKRHRKYFHFGISVALNTALGLAVYSQALEMASILGAVAVQMIIMDLLTL